jgi:hypothetical protein
MNGLSYVMPLRWSDAADLTEITGYLRWISARAELIVVDGSEPAAFEAHHRAWSEFCRHVRPDPTLRFAMGKVDGVLTGVALASNERVVVADDDVRYEEAPLRRVARLLEEHDLVWPQNYFDPLPWHARWDTARTLLNRAFSHDYPGTVGVRRPTLVAAGGYDGDVLFENLELRRTIDASGGRIASPLDLYVRRLPPSARHFISQRVRQAYDDFALPLRMGVFLAVAPTAAVAVTAGHGALVVGVGAAVVVGLAELGRRRAGGAQVFPATSALWAPAWVAERAVTTWLAVWQRFVRRGVAYGGGRIRRSASSRRALARRGSGPADLLGVVERMRGVDREPVLDRVRPALGVSTGASPLRVGQPRQ